MKIHGEHRFSAPRQEVWEALLDPEVLGRTVPGAERLERVGDNEFQGELKMKVGPVQGVFQGKVALHDLDPARGYTLKLDGRGAPGFVNGSGRIALEDGPSGGTVLRYDVDAQVGGRIAGVGQRLLESSAKVITRQALEALDAQIQARSGRAGGGNHGSPAAPHSSGPTTSGGSPPPSPSSSATGSAERRPSGVSTSSLPASAPPAPTTASFAAGVVKGVVVDLIPPRHRRKVAIAGIGVGAFLVLIGLRSCA